MPDVDIRAAVRAEVARAMWTQQELADRAGLTQPQVSAYLAGRKDLNGQSLDRLLTALGLDVTRPAR